MQEEEIKPLATTGDIPSRMQVLHGKIKAADQAIVETRGAMERAQATYEKAKQTSVDLRAERELFRKQLILTVNQLGEEPPPEPAPSIFDAARDGPGHVVQ